MQTSSEQALDLQPGARGRKGRDGTEETIKIKPIKDAVGDLMKLFKKAEAAKQDYNNAAKAVGERSNANTATIKKLIRTSANGNYQDARRLVEQEQVIFEAVGEVPAGPKSGE